MIRSCAERPESTKNPLSRGIIRLEVLPKMGTNRGPAPEIRRLSGFLATTSSGPSRPESRRGGPGDGDFVSDWTWHGDPTRASRCCSTVENSVGGWFTGSEVLMDRGAVTVRSWRGSVDRQMWASQCLWSLVSKAWSIRTAISFSTSDLGSGVSGAKRSVPFDVSYGLTSFFRAGSTDPLWGK